MGKNDINDLSDLDKLQSYADGQPSNETPMSPKGLDEARKVEMAPYFVKGLSRLADQRVQRAKVVGGVVIGILLLFLSIWTMGQVMAKDSKLVIHSEEDGYLQVAEHVSSFTDGTASSVLYAEAVENTDPISGKNDIPSDITSTDGSHNGRNYLAYTFYLYNTGSATLTVNIHIDITLNTKYFGDAARLRLYQGVYQESLTEMNAITYAKAAPLGQVENKTTYDQTFYSDTQILNEEFSLPGHQIKKYTIVMWLEGEDTAGDYITDYENVLNNPYDIINGGSFGFTVYFDRQ